MTRAEGFPAWPLSRTGNVSLEGGLFSCGSTGPRVPCAEGGHSRGQAANVPGTPACLRPPGLCSLSPTVNPVSQPKERLGDQVTTPPSLQQQRVSRSGPLVPALQPRLCPRSMFPYGWLSWIRGASSGTSAHSEPRRAGWQGWVRTERTPPACTRPVAVQVASVAGGGGIGQVRTESRPPK